MTKTEQNFYSLDRIKKQNAVYNIIIGERSNGKTYAVLKEGVKQFVNNGGQLAIVRRWQEDIKGRRAQGIFRSLIENGEIEHLTNGKYEGVYYYNGAFYLCHYENGRAIYNENDCLGYPFALSDMEKNKSISFPKITTIMFDEFLTKHMYLNDEFVLFMNTVSTIVRNRTNVKIYMLGNTVNKYSPYFKEMGLTHILDMEQGDIDVYKYGNSRLTVAVEYCEPNNHRQENNFYFAFNNPKLNMITDGAWELDIYPHIPMKYKPQDVLMNYFILFDDNIYQAEIVLKDVITFTYIHDKTTPLKDTDNDLIYSLEFNPKMNYNRNIYRPMNKVQQRVLWYFKTDRVFYQDNLVGDAINNYLKICKSL